MSRFEDIENADAWNKQYAFDSPALRVRNLTSESTKTAFVADLACVYANGPFYPAPIHSTGAEKHNGEVWVDGGQTRDVDLNCVNNFANPDGAWVTDATIDVGIVEDLDPWN